MGIVRFLVAAFVLCTAASCAENDSVIFKCEDGSEHDFIASRAISEVEAVQLANDFFSKNYSRSSNSDFPNVQYILNNAKSRNFNNVPDTVAYVVNYPDEKGFAIIAGDTRVNPVLAFNDSGNFNLSNEAVQENFISKIAPFIGMRDTISVEIGFEPTQIIGFKRPFINVPLGQGAPWNKYVDEEHPGCAVGCVAVAAALVLSHSCATLDYHGDVYNMKAIMRVLNKEWENDWRYWWGNSRDYDSSFDVTDSRSSDYQMTYDEAVDRMAKLLYNVGKDVNMKYGEISTTTSISAYYLCKSLNKNINMGYVDFNVINIIRYLKDDCIIYVNGAASGNIGHAWILDGYRYNMDPETKEISDAYVYCDWGWDGEDNGYYIGDIFETRYANYTPNKYFAAYRY